MRLDRHERRIPLGRAAAAVAMAFSLALDGAPAYAQRRQAEPEANPDFQNQVQSGSSSDSGGPVAAPGAGGGAGGAAVAEPVSGAPTSDTPPAGGGDEKMIEPRSVQSVQI